MQEHDDNLQHYAVSSWGEGYFQASANGMLSVRLPNHPGEGQPLHAIAETAREQGLDLPLLIRFPGILRHRASELCRAFQQAASELGYCGNYHGIYPIKVNQQRTVIEEIVRGGKGCVGLEAGSKPELMATLSIANAGDTIVCNGYKDREYIRLALIGRALGLRVFIVIEKASELQLVEKESAELGIEPLLGVRIRLATSAAGNWQNSGGEKAKFGLTATQLIQFVERLKSTGKLHWLHMLHSHIGSQIPNLRDIASGVNEAARYYAELHGLGAKISIIDVGGGLGVDYEGTRSRHYCSINYSLDNYAHTIITGIQRICTELSLPEPDIFSESGRALTAHHAVLVTNIIDRESPLHDADTSSSSKLCATVSDLHELLHNCDAHSPHEAYEEANFLMQDARSQFEHGQIDIHDWSQAEQRYLAICERIRPRLNPRKQRHRSLIDLLNVQLADKVFVNFSLFQSTPDVWAIEQIFPVLPLTQLDKPPTSTVILHDLTCDSDGCIEHYVDQEGIESTLPLHAAANGSYLLGIFLVGAYQEILGDMHNLFGDTHAVNVELETNGFSITEIETGDSVDELLRFVHFDPPAMLEKFRHKLDNSSLEPGVRKQYLGELSEGLHGYSYHEE